MNNEVYVCSVFRAQVIIASLCTLCFHWTLGLGHCTPHERKFFQFLSVVFWLSAVAILWRRSVVHHVFS